LSYITIPNPCKLLEEAELLGSFGNRKRWRCKKRLYEWDGLHGEIEVYDSRGNHLGVANCEGNFIKKAVKGRRIDV
jgi:hypothetical protein